METNEKMLNPELNDLTAKIKNTDERYSCITKSLQIAYWLFIPIYLVLIIRDIFSNSPLFEIAGSFCFLLGMLVFILIFRLYHLEYKSIDYAQPTLVMLKKAVRRYQPFQNKIWLTLLAVLLIDAGLSLRSLFDTDLIWIQVIFLGAMAAAVAIGLLIWRERYKPLRDKALQMIREIEGDVTPLSKC